MKTAIMGGTYDPPHVGHLFLAEEIRVQFGCEKIFIVPSHTPAHKTLDSRVTPEQRMEMVHLAIEGIPYFQLETCEIFREGISYSIDTVRCILASQDLDEKPYLVIGDDLFEKFMTWKDAPELLKLVDLLVAHRLYENKLELDIPHSYINNKIFPLSSTEIRERIRSGKAFRHLVPDSVWNYIIKNKLYLQEGSVHER